MLTILLEVKSNHPQRTHDNFYNPSPSEFKKFPRTENGINKAIKELSDLATRHNWIEDFRFIIFEGKYDYYKKDMKPKLKIESNGNITKY